MGILEKIKQIEDEIKRTQKNKATEYHLGTLKAKLAKYRSQLLSLDEKSGGGGSGEGFEAKKHGEARVVLIGFPSVGKSTLLNKITETESAVGAYEYTTLTSVPGVLEYKGSKIQILDLPGIIQGAAKGIGRGKQVVSTARTADLILMMMDASKGNSQKDVLLNELESVNIRVNKNPPKIYFKKRTGKIHQSGISYSSTVVQTKGVSEKIVQNILHSYKIHNAEIVIQEDVTVDDIIDVVDGNRVYIKCIYLYNKIDQIGIEQMTELALEDDSFVVSCEKELNLDGLIEKIWSYLDLIRVYHKKKGNAPDFKEPSIFPSGSTVKDICSHIHKDLVKQFKYGLVWGKSSKHQPQRVGLSHIVQDEDVVQVVGQN